MTALGYGQDIASRPMPTLSIQSLLALVRLLRSLGLFGLLAANLLSGCAVPDLQNYEGLEISDSEIAIIKNRWGACAFCIDDIYDFRDESYNRWGALYSSPPDKALYSRQRDGGIETFRLLPGKYQISAHYQPIKIRTVSFWAKVVLQKGHVYAVKEDACHCQFEWLCGCPVHTATMWFEDLSTGEVLGGHKW